MCPEGVSYKNWVPIRGYKFLSGSVSKIDKGRGRVVQAVGTASAKACTQRQLEHLRPEREGSGGGDGVLSPVPAEPS